MKASVLINNYNYKPYVAKAISSCLTQSYPDVEVILYDDGSTDGSVELIQQFSDQIKIIARPNHKRGHCWNQINAVNEAFKLSTGEVIFLLDSDDWFFPDKIEKVMKIFMQQPGLVGLQHPFRLVDEEDHFIKKLKRPIFSGVDILKSIYHTKRQDFYFTQTSGLCFSRSFLEQALPIQEDGLDLIAVDIRLSRMALFAGPFITVRDKHAAYRIHTKNHSSALKDKQYFEAYNTQNIEFFNRLARANNKPAFKEGNRFVAYFKVIMLLLRSRMKPAEKVEFIRSWIDSFLNK